MSVHKRKNVVTSNSDTSSALDTNEMDDAEREYFAQFDEKTNLRQKKRLDAVQSNDRGTDLEMCIFCKKQGAYFTTKQVRSGDESASYFYRCTLCNKKWTIR